MKFQVTNEADPLLVNTLVEGVRQHIHEQMGDEATQPLLVVARDNSGELLGGLYGRTIYKKLLIDTLWVDKNHRGTGLGKQLLNLAENEAIQRGCIIFQVDTLSIQSPLFYQKMGFEIVGEIPEYSGYPAHYFMIKTIN